MKLIKLSAVVLFLSVLTLPTVFDRVAHSQSSGKASTSATSTDTTTTDSPSTAPETTLTEQQSAALAATRKRCCGTSAPCRLAGRARCFSSCA